ncbi:SH3 beta-barrel fold-containing protein [Mucilaginibacter xinganensis]|nr:SH3 beta-barrel fold-containing protein [Mucilaginibacter xinganensis]
MKKRLFNIAWAVRKQFNTFSEALKHSWKVVKLQWALCIEAVVNFKYKKVDGSIREAKGSNESLNYTPSEKPKNTNFGVLVYFDLEACGFRSCKIENLIFN